MQNWIGAAGSTVDTADFVPPSPEVLPEFLDNWEKYYHLERPDPLVQLAVVHAQFEILHPFLDGNSRPVPTRPIPITIGGVGRRTLALVRDHADWWNLPVHTIGRLDELRDRAGTARVSLQLMVGLISSEDERASVTAVVQRRFGGMKLGESVVVGTAPEVAAHFSGLADRGVERFYVWFADFAPVATLSHFANVIDLTATEQ